MIKGFEDGKLWPFAVSGLICGMGYFIRPEAMQLLFYYFAFFIFNLFTGKYKLSRIKTIVSGIVLLLVFISPVMLYQNENGDFIPDKLEKLFKNKLDFERERDSEEFKDKEVSNRLGEGVVELNEKLFENMAWFFFPFAVLGFLDIYNRKKNYNTTTKLFFSVLVPLNIIIFLFMLPPFFIPLSAYSFRYLILDR